MFHVVLTDYMYDTITAFERVFAQEGVDFKACQCKTKQDVMDATEYADGVLTHFARLDSDVIAHLKNCKVLGRSAIGLDNIDVIAATHAKLPVIHVPKYCVQDVSDHVMMFLLALQKKLSILDKAVHQGVWDYSIAKPINRLQGKTLGLMGLGAIAREVAKKAFAFDLKVIAYDPYVNPCGVPQGVSTVELDDLFEQSDIISIHIPLTDETVGMLNQKAFARMKKKPILINTSRGGIIIEKDLAEALKNGSVSAAGLDVLEAEKIDMDNCLLNFSNVLVTPHSAWYSEESIENLQTLAAEDVCNILFGRPANGVANKI